MRNDGADAYANLTRAFFPGARLVRAWRLEGGVSARTEGLELAYEDGAVERLVVRQVESASFKSSEQAGPIVEHDLLSALHAQGLPVPRPRHVDTSCTILSRPYIIYDFVEGTSIGPESVAMADKMAHLLVRIHEVARARLPSGLPTRDSPLYDLGSWVDASVAAQAARVWCEGGQGTLLHGDYWPGNVIWQDGDIAALVDWEDVALGDPLSDLAAARAELRCAEDDATVRRFTDQYFAQASIPVHNLVVWDVYVSASALASMDHWGLPPDALARRKERTRAFFDEAVSVLTERNRFAID